MYGGTIDVDTQEFETVFEQEFANEIKNIVRKDEFGLTPIGTPAHSKKKDKKQSLSTLLQAELGVEKANSVKGFFRNPTNFMMGIARALPFLGGILAARELVDFISTELTKRGGLLDLTFRNRSEDRLNVLRSREQQAEIRMGYEGRSQLIITTRAGTVDPRNAYNTYEQRNDNLLEFEKMRAIRTTTGI